MEKGKYTHTAPRYRSPKSDRGLLYKVVRARLGVTQVAMAGILGIKRELLVQRECFKRVYSLGELQRLRDMSGLTWQELGELIDSIKVSD